MYLRRTRPLWVIGAILLIQPGHAQEGQSTGNVIKVDEDTQHESPTWLSWQAAPECPDGISIEKRVIEWLGGPPKVEAKLSVRANVKFTDAHWQVTVNISQANQQGKREVLVASCAEAADFVALSVVLALDPESLVGERAKSQEEEQSLKTPATLRAESEAEDVQPVKSIPDSSLQVETQKENSSESTVDARFSIRAYVETQALLNTGTFPSSQWGMGGELGVTIHSWLFGLGGRWFPSKGYSFEEARHTLGFSQIGGRMRTCYRFHLATLSLGPCVAFEAGSLQVSEAAATAVNRTHELWLAFSPGVSGSWRLFPWLAPSAGVELVLPLNQSRFVVDNGREVHQMGPGMSAWLGIRINFPPP